MGEGREDEGIMEKAGRESEKGTGCSILRIMVSSASGGSPSLRQWPEAQLFP